MSGPDNNYRVTWADEEKQPVREVKIVHPNHRITSDIMTRAEYCSVIGTRAAGIERGGPVYVEGKNMIGWDVCEIAREEIRQKRCPLKIIRHIELGEEEHWLVNEMAYREF